MDRKVSHSAINRRPQHSQTILLLSLFQFLLSHSQLTTAFHQLSRNLIVMLRLNLGYFLLGYWLGGRKLTPRARRLLYVLGAAAYLIAALGNLRQASPQSILLPFNGGYRLHHYFTSAAVFVLVRTFFENHAKAEAALSAPVAWLSNRVFGIYWVHVLVLEAVTRTVGAQMSILMFVGVRLGLTVLISLLFAAVVSKIPVLRRGLV